MALYSDQLQKWPATYRDAPAQPNARCFHGLFLNHAWLQGRVEDNGSAVTAALTASYLKIAIASTIAIELVVRPNLIQLDTINIVASTPFCATRCKCKERGEGGGGVEQFVLFFKMVSEW